MVYWDSSSSHWAPESHLNHSAFWPPRIWCLLALNTSHVHVKHGHECKIFVSLLIIALDRGPFERLRLGTVRSCFCLMKWVRPVKRGQGYHPRTLGKDSSSPTQRKLVKQRKLVHWDLWRWAIQWFAGSRIQIPFHPINYHLQPIRTSLVAQMVKNRLQSGRPGFDPWVGKISWRREWLPTPVFLPGKFHGQRSLAGYTVHGVPKTAEQLTHIDTDTDTHTQKHTHT